ncbi:hypothetical protein [Rhizobium grahamii]|uniref:hypothetical protein n=1 Tax=Rhizobium grahamii TaxID=1120045 RepID=UPI0032B30DE3
MTTNGSASWITASFALEYAALFRMLLPMLASYRLPMPLGGTSNHLRVTELKQQADGIRTTSPRTLTSACGSAGSDTAAASSTARRMKTRRRRRRSG